MSGNSIEMEATRVMKICSNLAGLLSKQAAKRKTIKHVIDLLSLLLGIVALFVALVPEVRNSIEEVVNYIFVGSGMMLIFSSLLDRMFKDHPDRYVDYAYYIGSYESSIRGALMEKNAEKRENRLRELIKMAEININDVRSKWPTIYSNKDERI